MTKFGEAHERPGNEAPVEAHERNQAPGTNTKKVIGSYQRDVFSSNQYRYLVKAAARPVQYLRCLGRWIDMHGFFLQAWPPTCCEGRSALTKVKKNSNRGSFAVENEFAKFPLPDSPETAFLTRPAGSYVRNLRCDNCKISERTVASCVFIGLCASRYDG